MRRLFLVPKPIPESKSETHTAAGPLAQLAAVDRAITRLHHARLQFSSVLDLASHLEQKLQNGTETFLAAWNIAHPEVVVQRCRDAASNAACLRFTMSPQALCDACRARPKRLMKRMVRTSL